MDVAATSWAPHNDGLAVSVVVIDGFDQAFRFRVGICLTLVRVSRIFVCGTFAEALPQCRLVVAALPNLVDGGDAQASRA